MRKIEGKRPFPPTAWIIIVLIWVVFGLYLYQLDGQSLWRDEILSVGRANQSFQQIVANINIVTGIESPDLHPPFYFLLLSVWRQVAGETEFAYRYLSVLMGVLAIPLFFATGSRIWSRTSGVWTAVFASLSPFYLWYAQETRMYALLVVESLLVIYALWPLLFPSPKKREFICFGLALTLALYTHYSGVYLLGFSLSAIFVSQFFRSRFYTQITWKHIGLTALLLVGILFLTIPLWSNLRELLTARGFIAFGRPSIWWLLLSGINTFTQGSTNPPDLPTWQMMPFILLAGVGALSLDVKPRERRWRAILISLGGLMGTLALFYAVSFIQANYSNPRHLMVLSPFLFLLLGHGLVTLYRHAKVIAVVIGGATLALSMFSLHQTITAPPVVRDDVRSLVAYIEERAKPGDTVIWHNAVMSMVYDYYQLELPTAVLPRYAQNNPTDVLDQLAVWQENSERIWFVRHPSPPFFDETIIPNALEESWIPIDGVGFPASWAILSTSLYQPLQKVVDLPEDALPAELTDGRYTLKGLTITPAITDGNGTWATLFWQWHGAATDEPPKVCIHLSEPESMMWSESCTFLRLPTNPASTHDSLLAHDVWLHVPPGLAPMPYEVTLIMGEQTEMIGTFRPERPLSPTSLSPIIEYENSLNLVDVAWLDEQFHTGNWVLGDLLWQVAQTPPDKLMVQARLVDWLGQPLSEQTIPIAPSHFPETKWLPGDLIRTRLAVPVPYRLNGRYRLQIALTDETGTPIHTKSWLPGRTWTTLDTIIIADWPLLKSLPPDSTALSDEVVLGDNLISLEAYNLEREGKNLHVTLYWRSVAESDKNFATFVHVG
ncbi:MAG: hypothetical protein GWP17_05420, partial [Aquificales bacterium]|nr:hypothetical protein [Aquificales bacterium]